MLTDEQQEQALLVLRVHLYAAVQRLKGVRLDELLALLAEVVDAAQLEQQLTRSRGRK